MNRGNQPQVITYVPKDSSDADQPASDMGTIRRGLWMYTHKLGLNFSLVLFLSLIFQAFVSVFIALNGMKTLPVFSGLNQNEIVPRVLGDAAAIIITMIIQGLIIAEMAQVVWLRHPDKLKVRLMSGSVWWWIMLAALLFTIILDFLLLFMSITGRSNIQDAWASVQRNQMTGITILLLSILNFLTLLRCAAVMRTSTSEEIRREVEERLSAIAEEILIDAGDSARAKAAKVWKKLSVNPQRFVPIHDSVLGLVSKNHPTLVPPQIGGDTWAYDFTGNTFAVLPPDVHQALLQNRYRQEHDKKPILEADENQLLWKLSPQDTAEMINFNLTTYGKPRFVDITEVDNPKFLTRPIQLGALGLQPTATEQQPMQPTAPNPLIGAQPTQSMSLAQFGSPQTTAPVMVQDKTTFVNGLPPTEKALFGSYLTHTVFPHVHGQKFPTGVVDLSIFEVFDNVELQWYYRYWKKNSGR
jgi:hypothetical protein